MVLRGPNGNQLAEEVPILEKRPDWVRQAQHPEVVFVLVGPAFDLGGNSFSRWGGPSWMVKGNQRKPSWGSLIWRITQMGQNQASF